MTESDDLEAAALPHRETFVQHLDEAFRRYGYVDGLPPSVRAAVETVPRHRFVHRFRTGPDGPLHDFDADAVDLLPLVYRGHPLTHVAADGSALPSTNSEASYVLWLVARLGIEPGHTVLEIGSGSGWLLAVMAHLVGPNGSATGVEILSDLANQARGDLTASGCGNAQILTADATTDPIPGGPFDRVIVTAATWSLPQAFFDLVAEGGKVLVPLRLPRDEGCDVTLLRREGHGFEAEWSSPGFFVPLVGANQSAEISRIRIDDWTAQFGVAAEPSLSYPLWFGSLAPYQPGPALQAYRRYLALTEPGFTVFEPFGIGPSTPKWVSEFGVLDTGRRSAVILRAGRLDGYGAPDATIRLLEAYRRWCDLGMPGPGAYSLHITASEYAVDGIETALTEVRGKNRMARSLGNHAGSWKDLLTRASP
ncbi:hypothetical protein MFUR16E_12765 [Methylobacterium fujisawaense]|uniref:protein-L-isoaspartate O-methyltransferase family protein n=1 Tax=Methylobacterium fujisawaense TaxID=107400 RepID=UPI002F2BD5AA